MFHLYTAQKTSENLWFSDIFKGVYKWNIGLKYINKYYLKYSNRREKPHIL